MVGEDFLEDLLRYPRGGLFPGGGVIFLGVPPPGVEDFLGNLPPGGRIL